MYRGRCVPPPKRRYRSQPGRQRHRSRHPDGGKFSIPGETVPRRQSRRRAFPPLYAAIHPPAQACAARSAAGVAHLEQHVIEHGHAPVPVGFVWDDGFPLGRRATGRRSERRRSAPASPPERITQLDDLGFKWEPPQGPRRAP
jgi:hypothetical protein